MRRSMHLRKPDLIAVTGGIVDGSVPQLAAHTRPLSDLKARHGASLGDRQSRYYAGADKWVAEFRRLGLTVLLNEHVVVDHDGARAVIAGVTDYARGVSIPHRKRPGQGDPRCARRHRVPVLLEPISRAARRRHRRRALPESAGCIRRRALLPWNFFVRLATAVRGRPQKLNDLWVYTSHGTGYWGRRSGSLRRPKCRRLRLLGGNRRPRVHSRVSTRPGKDIDFTSISFLIIPLIESIRLFKYNIDRDDDW